MKEVLFINSGFDLGGIETFVARAAQKLQGQVKFTLLLMSDSVNSDLLAKFEQYGDVYFLDDLLSFKISKYAILRTIMPLNSKKIRRIFQNIKIIHASCSFSVPLMRRLTSILGNDVVESVGVYHSREFLWGDKKKTMRRKQISLFSSIPMSNVIFMNDYTAKMYSGIYNNIYTNALPIGIELNAYSSCTPDYSSKRIVSIGRLVDFKTYNKHMIKTLSELKSSFKFEVYGDGPELGALQKIADNVNVDVTFHGRLEYKKMPDILNGASLFIGSGTAIVEAAAAGLPCIIGVESIQEPKSYGFLTQTQGLSFQEMGLDYPLKNYIDLVNDFSSLTEAEFMKTSAEHRARAEVFSSENMCKILLDYYSNLTISKARPKVGFMYTLGVLKWLVENKYNVNNERKTMYDF